MSNQELEVNNSKRKLILKFIALLFMIFGGIALIILLQIKDENFNLSGKARLGKGASAPAFTLSDLNGKSVKLSDYKGKVVLLNIWATWCPPCVEEMPSMERLYQNFKGQDFEILAVSIDTLGVEAVLPFMKKNKLNFPALINSDGKIQSLYQTTGVPESFIIDKNGIIAEKIIGPRDWAAPQVVRYIDQLIQQN
jgi:peroxiredoxin